MGRGDGVCMCTDNTYSVFPAELIISFEIKLLKQLISKEIRRQQTRI